MMMMQPQDVFRAEPQLLSRPERRRTPATAGAEAVFRAFAPHDGSSARDDIMERLMDGMNAGPAGFAAAQDADVLRTAGGPQDEAGRLAWPVAAVVILGLSAGLWMGIARLVSYLVA